MTKYTGGLQPSEFQALANFRKRARHLEDAGHAVEKMIFYSKPVGKD